MSGPGHTCRYPTITLFCVVLQFELKFQQSVPDVQLCGGKFLDPEGESFGVTGYDLSEVVLFSKQ